MSEKPKMKPGFEGVWSESFSDLKEIGGKAWLLRLYLRVHTNQTTRICDPKIVTERAIQKNLGWDRKTTRKAIRKLLELGYIVNQGHCRYYVRHGWQLSTDGGKTPPTSRGKNSPTLGEKLPHSMGKNSPTLGEKLPHPYIQTQNITEPDTGLNNLGNVKDVLKTVGKDYGDGSSKQH